jgi:hypothetical protein
LPARGHIDVRFDWWRMGQFGYVCPVFGVFKSISRDAALLSEVGCWPRERVWAFAASVPFLGAVLVCAVLVCAAGCDSVEHAESHTAVGGLQVDERCTIRRPWLPDSVVDTTCVKALRKADGTTINPRINVATLDPTGKQVAATADRRAWVYDARTGAPLGEQALPCNWSYPSWSPDGTAFVLWDGALGFYVTEVPLRGDPLLVEARSIAVGYQWSPSGQRLAYVMTTDERSGHARAELWVWERASRTKRLSVTRTFVSWSASTAWAGWVGEDVHLCSDYFSDPDPACSTATRPK